MSSTRYLARHRSASSLLAAVFLALPATPLRAPERIASTVVMGRVLDAGTADTAGNREGIRLDLDAPARLVLAESFNRGRRATCDGRDLAPPELGAIYGTAWRVPAGCQTVAVTFAPNRAVRAGYAVSLVAVLILLLLVIRGGGGGPADPPPAVTTTPQRLSLTHAALAAVPAGLALGAGVAANWDHSISRGVRDTSSRIGHATLTTLLLGTAAVGVFAPGEGRDGAEERGQGRARGRRARDEASQAGPLAERRQVERQRDQRDAARRLLREDSEREEDARGRARPAQSASPRA